MRQYVAKMEILYFVQRAQRENNPTKSTLPRNDPFFFRDSSSSRKCGLDTSGRLTAVIRYLFLSEDLLFRSETCI